MQCSCDASVDIGCDKWSPCIVFIKRDDGSYIEWVEKGVIKKIPEYLSNALKQWEREREQDDEG